MVEAWWAGAPILKSELSIGGHTTTIPFIFGSKSSGEDELPWIFIKWRDWDTSRSGAWGGGWTTWSFDLTCVACSVTSWSKVYTLWAGAGVTTRSEETQVAAGSFTRVLDCKHRKVALLNANMAKEDLAFECLQISINEVFTETSAASLVSHLNVAEMCDHGEFKQGSYRLWSCISAAGTQRSGSARARLSAAWSWFHSRTCSAGTPRPSPGCSSKHGPRTHSHWRGFLHLGKFKKWLETTVAPGFPVVVLGVVKAHLCRQKFVCPLLRASQTQCDSPWSPTSRFCPRWWSQQPSRWANPVCLTPGLSCAGRPAKSTQSLARFHDQPSTASCKNTVLIITIFWFIEIFVWTSTLLIQITNETRGLKWGQLEQNLLNAPSEFELFLVKRVLVANFQKETATLSGYILDSSIFHSRSQACLWATVAWRWPFYLLCRGFISRIHSSYEWPYYYINTTNFY